MSDINITPNSPNTVTIQNADNIITVTDTSKHTEVDITQEITDIVNVVTPGPQGTQGIQGPAGQGFDEPFTGSIIISGSIQLIGDQTITGSFTLSGSSTFTNIGPAIFSGSVTTTQGFTGSLSGTASYADMATTASYALFAVSASHEIVKEVSSSHANTADVANGLQGQPSIYVTNITSSGNISASGIYTGDGSGLTNIPASGITGLNLSQIASGSATASISPNNGFVVNTNTTITGSAIITGSLEVRSNNSVIYFESGSSAGSNDGKILMKSTGGPANLSLWRTDGKQAAYNVGSSGVVLYYDDTGYFGIQPTSTPAEQTSFGGATAFYMSSSGKVGINTNDPKSRFYVVGKIATTTDVSASGDMYGVTGSFQHLLGDGSQLTGIETDPFPYTGDVQITGSLIVSGSGITIHSGSLNLDDNDSTQLNIPADPGVYEASYHGLTAGGSGNSVSFSANNVGSMAVLKAAGRLGVLELNNWTSGLHGVYLNGYYTTSPLNATYQRNFIGNGLVVNRAHDATTAATKYGLDVVGPTMITGSNSNGLFGLHVSSSGGSGSMKLEGNAQITGSLSLSGSQDIKDGNLTISGSSNYGIIITGSSTQNTTNGNEVAIVDTTRHTGASNSYGPKITLKAAPNDSTYGNTTTINAISTTSGGTGTGPRTVINSNRELVYNNTTTNYNGFGLRIQNNTSPSNRNVEHRFHLSGQGGGYAHIAVSQMGTGRLFLHGLGSSGIYGMMLKADQDNYLIIGPQTSGTDGAEVVRITSTAFKVTGNTEITGDITSITEITASGNISSSATSTASFGTYLGDGSQLTGIETDPFPYTGDVQITGSLTVSGSLHAFTLDSDSVILGQNAAKHAAATAEYNVIIGVNAGVSASNDNNVLIGRFAGEKVTGDGSDNVFIGLQAGQQGANKEMNVAIGRSAMIGYSSADSSDRNVALGYYAGRLFQNSTDNIAVGYYAGHGNGSGGSNAVRNVFLGAYSGYNHWNGIQDNIYVGYYAGAFNQQGDRNIIIGSGSTANGNPSDQLRIGHSTFHIISGSLTTGDVIFASTASAEYFVGDGSQLTGIETDPFPFSGSAVITGSLTVSGSVVDFTSASSVLLNIESIPLVNPIVEYITTSAITSSGTTVPLPNALTFVSSSTYEYLEVFINGLRMRYDMDFSPASTSTVTYYITIPSGAEVTYKSLKRP